MSEWFKELVLKTSDPARDQGFESLSLRQAKRPSLLKKARVFLLFSKLGIDKLRSAGQVGQHEITVKNQEQKVKESYLSKKAEALTLP